MQHDPRETGVARMRVTTGAADLSLQCSAERHSKTDHRSKTLQQKATRA